MKKVIEEYKNNKTYRFKVIKFGLVVFVLGVSLIALFTLNNSKSNSDSQNKKTQLNNRMPENYISSDSISFVDDKTEYYKDQEEFSDVVIPKSSNDSSENNLGIDSYMNRRKKTVARMNAPTRRKYNPNPPVRRRTLSSKPKRRSNSVAPTSVIVPKRRSLDLPVSSIVSKKKEASAEKKILSPEEKLEESIRNKYSESGLSSENQTIDVVVHNDQNISNGNKRIRLRLLHSIVVENTTIGTDAFVYANASFNESIIELKTTNLSYKGKNYPFEHIAYDYLTGMPGIQVNEDNLLGTSQEVIEREATGRIGQGGVIGGVIRNVLSGRNRRVKIVLFDEHRLYLR